MKSSKGIELKIQKLEEKVAKVQRSLCKTKGELKYKKQRLKEVMAGREKWKQKSKSNQLENNRLRALVSRGECSKRHHYSNRLVVLSILLRIKCGCSYKSIPKILGLLNRIINLKLAKIPCANSIENWVSKVGLYSLENGTLGNSKAEVSLILDESIRIGQEKLLLGLICPLNKENENTLKHEDVEVLFMKGQESWTSEKIVKELKEELVEKGIKVVNILSDEDPKLKKASRLLEVDHLADISHGIATCLRQVFDKDIGYKKLMALLGNYISKGVNQKISYLCPPKQRSKARFMNLSAQIKWAKALLGQQSKLSEAAELFFRELQDYKPLIEQLSNCLAVAQTVSIALKKEGLSVELLKELTKKLKALDRKDEYLDAFVTKVEGYLLKYNQVMANYEAGIRVHISSEVIESIFGKYKNKANNYGLTGLTKLNLEIPLYCKSEKGIRELTSKALESISINYLEEWVKEHSSENQLIKRIEFFKEAA